MDVHKFLVGGKWAAGDSVIQVRNPYDESLYTEVCAASPDHLHQAVDKAVRGFEKTRRMSTHERTSVLNNVISGIIARMEKMARTITMEAGKPIKDSRVEVSRSVNTFGIAVEEAKRFGGALTPLDSLPATQGRWGITRRFPVGPVLAISPFNFPLNLLAHKVAPAVAVGNPVIIKPSSATPLTALTLGEILLEAGYPPEAVSVVPCKGSAIEAILSDERMKKVSFTGSPAVGWRLKSLCGKMKITLELGGNAAVIIDDPESLDYAVDRCVTGSFSFAGQICISVQRIIVREDLYDGFVQAFVEKTRKLTAGNPLYESTDIGPMINAGAVAKAMNYMEQAVDKGANVLLGGEISGNMFPPTILENVPRNLPAYCDEIFAPVVLLAKYKDFDDALAEVNDSDYGLQAGVFTADLKKAWKAFETLEVGGVMIGDVPTFRVDQMPYGGVKNSGFGREGLIYAMEEMTELRLMMINNL